MGPSWTFDRQMTASWSLSSSGVGSGETRRKDAMRDVVLLLGMQAAGKSTIGRLLAEDANVTHMSAGSLLREHARDEGPHSAEILAQIDAGDPASASISYGLLGERARSLDNDQLL